MTETKIATTITDSPQKKWYQSKTFWAGILEIVAGIATALSADLTAGGALTAFGIIQIVLRVVTSSKLIK